MSGKGPDDTRTPDHAKRRENHAAIDWTRKEREPMMKSEQWKPGKIFHVHGMQVRLMATLDGGRIRCGIKGTDRHFVVGNTVPIDGVTYICRKAYNQGRLGELEPVPTKGND